MNPPGVSRLPSRFTAHRASTSHYVIRVSLRLCGTAPESPVTLRESGLHDYEHHGTKVSRAVRMFCPPAPPPSLPRALAPAVANLFDETALEEIGALPPAFSLEYLPSVRL